MAKEKTNDLLVDILDGPIPLRPFFEALPLGVIITDMADRVLFCNQAQAGRDGLEAAEALGRPIFEVCRTEDWPVDFFSNSRLASPRAWRGRSRTGSGRTAEVSMVLSPLVRAGAVIGSIYTTEFLGPASDLSTSPVFGRETEVADGAAFQKIIGRSPGLLKAIELGRAAARSPSPVLISGETGTGKELFARSLHEHSPRAGRAFVPINCAAIPPDLLEGMLFGTTRGAFTGATDKIGLFEEADQGTLFLDELDSMPLKLQPKLLRVLQDRKIRRVGGAREVELNVKIVSAIGASPNEALREGRLRPDLFYRLGVMIIKLPPLRERPDDLELLAGHFIKKHNEILGRQVRGLSPEVLEAFRAYGWPGNARELEHIIEAVLNIATECRLITLEMLPDHFSISSKMTLSGACEALHEHGELCLAEPAWPGPELGLPTLKDREREMISKALQVAGGNVAQAARILNISRQLLVYKMKKHSLNRLDFTG